MSDSDEDYNPAEVAVAVTTPALTVTPAIHSMTGAAATHAPARSALGSLPRLEPHAGPPRLAAQTSTTAAREADAPLDHGGVRLHALKGRVRCLCVNPEGTLLCAGGEDGQLAMWDFLTALPSRRVHPTRVLTPFVNRIAGLQPIVAAHFSSDGAYLVACQDGDSPALVAAGGRQLGYCAMGERGVADVVRCKGHRAPVTSSAAHGGLAGGFFTGAQDGTARLWDQASFVRGSLYAVKHGSGQITDTVVVESVLGLARFRGAGGGAVFGSAGEDGCVQLWDSRTRYRPGGVLAAWDVFGLPRQPTAATAGRVEDAEEVFEKHTGGMAELASAVDAILAVRRGTVVQLLDLRRLPPARTVGRGAEWLAAPAISGLSHTLDTTGLHPTGDGRGFVTGTSRAGLEHVVGGHVALYTLDAAESSAGSSVLAAPRLRTAWRVGSAEEDVLCAATDVAGRLYAGLSSGDVVVQRGHGDGSPVEEWLTSRPARGAGGGDKDGGEERVPGQKSTRADDVDDLF